jgi:hypothetical protein
MVAFPVVMSLNESFDSVMAGISSSTSPRKVGAAGDPLVGPAKTELAFWLSKVAVKVPFVVIGEPLTSNTLDGSASATEVTVPDPGAIVDHVPSPRRNVDDDAEPLPNLAVLSIPLVTFEAAIFGTPVSEITGVDV